MSHFCDFLKQNKLLKKDIAAYLKVSNAFITQLCNGERVLPEDKKALILTNKFGWDCSYLDDKSTYAHEHQVVAGDNINRLETTKRIRTLSKIIEEMSKDKEYMKAIIDAQAQTIEVQKALIETLQGMKDK